MALNPQPYLAIPPMRSDRCSPVIAGGIVNDIVILSFGTSDLENQDSTERILGFLQMWMALPDHHRLLHRDRETIRYGGGPGQIRKIWNPPRCSGTRGSEHHGSHSAHVRHR